MATTIDPAPACCQPLTGAPLSAADAGGIARLCKALGEANRVRLVNLLAVAAEPVCVCDLIEPLGVSQATVSHHLRVLLDAGLVRRERRGSWVYYAVEDAALAQLADTIAPRRTEEVTR